MIEIAMPRAGQSMEEGTIVEWVKAEGDVVEKGEILAEIETDKATFEFESPESGTLLKILCGEESVVGVLETIALMGAPDEDPDAYLANRPDAASTRPKASPAARKAAGEAGIDLSALAAGSGPAGRILSTDLPQQAAPAAGETQLHPISKMRKAIAANLQYSKQNVPHFYARLTIDARAMMAFYRKAKADFECSVNDVVTFACARAVAEFPALRSRFTEDGIVELPAANIGLAVASDDGLVVPVLIAADRMDLKALAAATRRVVESARAGRLEGAGQGVFTITNLGMFGVEEFSAIINPPESAILAVGAVREDVVVTDGAMQPGLVMTMTLSSDHRVIDGATAAKFLARLKELLEKPEP